MSVTGTPSGDGSAGSCGASGAGCPAGASGVTDAGGGVAGDVAGVFALNVGAGKTDKSIGCSVIVLPSGVVIVRDLPSKAYAAAYSGVSVAPLIAADVSTFMAPEVELVPGKVDWFESKGFPIAVIAP